MLSERGCVRRGPAAAGGIDPGYVNPQAWKYQVAVGLLHGFAQIRGKDKRFSRSAERS